MKTFRIALCALALAGITQARPLIVEESSTITPPNSSWQYFGRFGVAIDGDWALVSGERFVPDPSEGERHEGAAFLYRRTATGWDYAGRLGPVQTITEWVSPGLAMKNGIAMTNIDGLDVDNGAKIFERTGSTWTQAPFSGGGPYGFHGRDIEIDSPFILVSRISCNHNSVVLRKISGTWTAAGELRGHPSLNCGDNPPSNKHDLQNGRAIVFNDVGPDGEPHLVRFYFLNEDGVSWRQAVEFQDQNLDTSFGPDVAVSGQYTAIAGSLERGAGILVERNQSWDWSLRGLQPVDSYMQRDPALGNTTLRRSGTMFAQRNYSYNRGAYVFNIFRVNDDYHFSSTHMTTLQAKQGASLGDLIDTSGNSIIVNGRVGFTGSNTVRVFEVPQEHLHAGVQVHDFESDSDVGQWQPIAGSAFTVENRGNTRVYRQSSTAGDAGSVLATLDSKDQSIQGEVTVRSFAGADRWVGLMTRRQDASNYYYVTLRSSGTVQLRRRVNGVFATLASAPAAVTVGRKYLLRLESIGTAHRVYLDHRLVLTAHDTTHSLGNAGVVMYRTSADFDNVIVSPSPLSTIYTQNFATTNPGKWDHSGSWTSTGGVFRQTSTTGNARAVIGAATDDQIVQVRVRPTVLAGGNRWVGVVARYEDDLNYLYVSLRNNNTISLRRLNHGNIQVLAERQFNVSAGTWYKVRVEVLTGITRVYVNDVLQLASDADPGPVVSDPEVAVGKVGLFTYRASADYDDFLAYQP